jgi:FAD:protein FMN transferase
MQVLDLDIIGTHLQISIDTPHSCDEVFSDIRIRLQDFEQKYSRFIEWNWLYSLNKNRTEEVSIDAKKMLQYMLQVARDTDWYFDPTVGKRLTELWYGNRKLEVESIKHDILSYWDYRDIEVEWDVVILHWNIILEFWWVGKWYLIDVMHDMLKIYPRFLINFGWDFYGKWGWIVWLENSFASDEVIGTHILDDGFLACSAGTKRKWENHHHLINPKTGESATEVIASYVEWISWMVVDVYATTLCVMPWELACETLEKTQEISGVIVSADGKIYQKAGSRAKVFS